MNPTSLTTQIVLQRFTSTQLEELGKEINRHTYRYILEIENIEYFRISDLFCLKSIIVTNALDLVLKLSEEDKIIKYLYESSIFRYKILQMEIASHNIFSKFPMGMGNKNNEKEIANYLRTHIEENIILDSIVECTLTDIKIFDNSFDRVYLIKKDDYEIAKMSSKTKLYSYLS